MGTCPAELLFEPFDRLARALAATLPQASTVPVTRSGPAPPHGGAWPPPAAVRALSGGAPRVIRRSYRVPVGTRRALESARERSADVPTVSPAAPRGGSDRRCEGCPRVFIVWILRVIAPESRAITDMNRHVM